MDLITILSLSVASFLAIYLWVQKRFKFWIDRGFVQMEPVEFPYGNMKGIGTKINFAIMLKNCYDKYKNKAPILGVFFFLRPTVTLLDLNVIKNVLMKDFNKFNSRGVYHCPETDPLSGHLFAMEGQEWKNMRTKLTPTFTSGKMKMMFNIVLEISNEMKKYLSTECSISENIELKDVLSRFTTDVIGNIAFGLEMNSMENPNSEFRRIGKKFVNLSPLRMLKAFFINSFPQFSKKWGLVLTDPEVTSFFVKSMKETIDYREKNKIRRNDFLDLLIQLKNHGKFDGDSEEFDKITFDELIAQCFLFFIAGFETSATTMTFCLYELALNQEIQEKLREEIKTFVQDNDELTYESMVQMKYLQKVIDETLRKYPPFDFLMRYNSEDYKVPDHDLVIPKNCLTVIPVYAIQRDPEYYPDPEKFDPERFNEENRKNRNPMTFLPFGDGPRNCIGSRFGYMMIKIGIVQLLKNFKFSACSKTTIPMKFKPSVGVLSPANDMWLKIEKLN